MACLCLNNMGALDLLKRGEMLKLLRLLLLLIASYIAQEVSCSTCSSKSEQKYASSPIDRNDKHINIVLLGATGNLAKKYLWQSLFEVYKDLVHERQDCKFSIYAASREEYKEGRQTISNILLNLEKCLNDECQKLKKGFTEIIQYVKLSSEKDYEDLKSKMNENTQSLYAKLGTAKTNEVGRLFYLAIPPSAYGQTTLKIHKHLMPQFGNPWVRIVIEKPFGSNLETAVALNRELLQSFDESQIYRVDHYLGKTVVKEMLPFRIINSDKYGHLWNKDHVERVEVVLKESEDVVGRTGFYNENGVLRDVMQNHMTEMLALTTMELPKEGGKSIKEIHKLKLDLLSKLRPTKNEKSQLITGQYSTYNSEWLAETRGTNQVTEVPTFAAAAFYVENENWKGVPFVFITGKKLDKKSSYVRFIFKDDNCPGQNCSEKKQIIFYVCGYLGEAIAVSPGLAVPDFVSNWVELKNSEGFEQMFHARNLKVFAPAMTVPPYTSLIKASVEGARHLFVPSEVLYEAWKFWTPLIKMSSNTRPRSYLGRGKDPEKLEFVVEELLHQNDSDNGGVHFLNSETFKKKVEL